MLKNLGSRLTYANVMATIAVFVAFGGTGYAAVTINGKNLKNNTIAGKKLKKNTIGGKQVKESRLGKVRTAGSADRAKRADAATRAGSATSATSAANADNLDGQDSSSFKLRCPAGTVLVSGLCMETSSARLATWEKALAGCADSGRYLPSLGQLLMLARSGQFPDAGLDHWSDSGAVSQTSPFGTHAYTVRKEATGMPAHVYRDAAYPWYYRCVVSPTN